MFLVIACWLVAGLLCAQQLVLKSYDRSSGLVSDYVMTMIQDRDGFIWFGTDRGLSQYDGKAFTSYTTRDGMPDNFITHLFQDSKGYIWFSVFERGIVRFDGVTMQSFSPANGYPFDNVGGMAEDQYGRLYIVSSNGVFALDGGTVRKIHSSTPYSMVTSLPGGSILFSVEDTLFRIEPTKTECTKYRKILTGNSKAILSLGVFQHPSRAWDNGEIYIGTSEGLSIFRFQSDIVVQRVARYSLEGRISTIIQQGDSVIWYGTSTDGFYRVTRDTTILYDRRQGLLQERVETLMRDYEGNLWISVFGSGVQKLVSTSVVVYRQSDGLKENYISAVYEDSRKRMWIGTSSGLAVLERDSIRHVLMNEPFMKEVRAIREDHTGRFYIGTLEYLFGPATYEDILRGYPVPRLRIPFGVSGIIPVVDTTAAGQRASIWISTFGRGLTKLSGNDSVSFLVNDGVGSNVLEQAIRGTSALWFLTRNNGVTRYARETFDVISTNAGLPSPSVFSLWEEPSSDSSGVWIGTDRGVTYLRNGYARTFTERDGIVGLPVLGIFPDRQAPAPDTPAVWIITPKAMHHFEGGSLHLCGTFTMSQKEMLGINDLLISSENDLWCATSHGLYALSLANFHRTSVAPKVTITRVLQDTTMVFRHTNPGSTTTLPVLDHSQNTIMIEYAGLSFVSEPDISYRSRLEPIEESWSQLTHDTHILYRNLQSGEYRFSVVAVTTSGVTSPVPAVVAFKILPPFWKRWWFLLIFGLGILAVGYFGTRLVFRRKLRNQAREYERKQALQNERDRISRDLHDNVGAQLVNIISGIELAGRYSESQYAEIKKILSLVNEDTRITMALLRETIWALHTPGMVVGTFARELDTYIRKQLRYHPGINFRFQQEGDMNTALRPVEAMNLLRVVQEALSNSLKHASPTVLDLMVHVQEDHTLCLVFKNDGCHQQCTEELSGGKGIPNMERRVGELGGTFRFSPGEDRTATVEVSVPLGRE